MEDGALAGCSAHGLVLLVCDAAGTYILLVYYEAVILVFRDRIHIGIIHVVVDLRFSVERAARHRRDVGVGRRLCRLSVFRMRNDLGYKRGTLTAHPRILPEVDDLRAFRRVPDK